MRPLPYAQPYSGRPRRATIAKCNVDDCEDIAAQFGVRNIPTLVFVKNGAVVDRTVGVMPKQELEAKINLYL